MRIIYLLFLLFRFIFNYDIKFDLDQKELTDGFHGVIREDDYIVHTTPIIKVINNAHIKICFYNISNIYNTKIPFQIHVKNKNIGLAHIIATEKLDCQSQMEYKFNISAIDCTKSISSKPVPVHISVLDVNEFDPYFDQNLYYAEIESGKIYDIIIKLKASDKDCSSDFNSICSYIIINGNSNVDGLPIFNINNEGIIKNFAPLYNTDQKFDLEIIAEDCGGRKSKPVFVSIKIIPHQGCRDSWNHIPQKKHINDIKYPVLISPNAHLHICNRCEIAQVSATVILNSFLDIEKAKGCDRGENSFVEVMSPSYKLKDIDYWDSDGIVSASAASADGYYDEEDDPESLKGTKVSESSFKGTKIEGFRYKNVGSVQRTLKRKMRKCVTRHNPRKVSSSSHHKLSPSRFILRSSDIIDFLGIGFGIRKFQGDGDYIDVSDKFKQRNDGVTVTRPPPSLNKPGVQDNRHGGKILQPIGTTTDYYEEEPIVGLGQNFSFAFWMRHDMNLESVKEHLFCRSDSRQLNRHHLALFVKNCKLVLLLREELYYQSQSSHRPAQRNNSILRLVDQGDHTDRDWKPFHNNNNNPLNFKGDRKGILTPSEVRWKLPEVCDSSWHHYVINVVFPRQFQLMIDGKLFKPTTGIRSNKHQDTGGNNNNLKSSVLDGEKVKVFSVRSNAIDEPSPPTDDLGKEGNDIANFALENPQIVEDWPLHSLSPRPHHHEGKRGKLDLNEVLQQTPYPTEHGGTKADQENKLEEALTESFGSGDIRSITGACWEGRRGKFDKYFRGHLSEFVLIKRHVLSHETVSECLLDCLEGLFGVSPNPSADRKGTTTETILSEYLDLRANTLEEMESKLRHIAYGYADLYPSPPYQSSYLTSPLVSDPPSSTVSKHPINGTNSGAFKRRELHFKDPLKYLNVNPVPGIRKITIKTSATCKSVASAPLEPSSRLTGGEAAVSARATQQLYTNRLVKNSLLKVARPPSLPVETIINFPDISIELKISDDKLNIIDESSSSLPVISGDVTQEFPQNAAKRDETLTRVGGSTGHLGFKPPPTTSTIRPKLTLLLEGSQNSRRTTTTTVTTLERLFKGVKIFEGVKFVTVPPTSTTPIFIKECRISSSSWVDSILNNKSFFIATVPPPPLSFPGFFLIPANLLTDSGLEFVTESGESFEPRISNGSLKGGIEKKTESHYIKMRRSKVVTLRNKASPHVYAKIFRQIKYFLTSSTTLRVIDFPRVQFELQCFYTNNVHDGTSMETVTETTNKVILYMKILITGTTQQSSDNLTRSLLFPSSSNNNNNVEIINNIVNTDDINNSVKIDDHWNLSKKGVSGKYSNYSAFLSLVPYGGAKPEKGPVVKALFQNASSLKRKRNPGVVGGGGDSKLSNHFPEAIPAAAAPLNPQYLKTGDVTTTTRRRFTSLTAIISIFGIMLIVFAIAVFVNLGVKLRDTRQNKRSRLLYGHEYAQIKPYELLSSSSPDGGGVDLKGTDCLKHHLDSCPQEYGKNISSGYHQFLPKFLFRGLIRRNGISSLPYYHHHPHKQQIEQRPAFDTNSMFRGRSSEVIKMKYEYESLPETTPNEPPPIKESSRKSKNVGLGGKRTPLRLADDPNKFVITQYPSKDVIVCTPRYGNKNYGFGFKTTASKAAPYFSKMLKSSTYAISRRILFGGQISGSKKSIAALSPIKSSTIIDPAAATEFLNLNITVNPGAILNEGERRQRYSFETVNLGANTPSGGGDSKIDTKSIASISKNIVDIPRTDLDSISNVTEHNNNNEDDGSDIDNSTFGSTDTDDDSDCRSVTSSRCSHESCRECATHTNLPHKSLAKSFDENFTVDHSSNEFKWKNPNGTDLSLVSPTNSNQSEIVPPRDDHHRIRGGNKFKHFLTRSVKRMIDTTGDVELFDNLKSTSNPLTESALLHPSVSRNLLPDNVVAVSPSTNTNLDIQKLNLNLISSNNNNNSMKSNGSSIGSGSKNIFNRAIFKTPSLLKKSNENVKEDLEWDNSL